MQEKIIKLMDEHQEQVAFLEGLKEDREKETNMYKKLQLIKRINEEEDSLLEIVNDLNETFLNGNFYQQKEKNFSVREDSEKLVKKSKLIIPQLEVKHAV